MTDWADGYVQNIDYTYGYYAEMNPARVKLAFLVAGLESPDISSCCEMGFGHGISLNIHAAASGMSWHGNDFNPAHVRFAMDVASQSGAQVSINDDSFEEYHARDDMPMFDYIALHGIWSWISPKNRAAIITFIRKRLKVGGVVYISYNTLPGWAKFMPVRELMISHHQDFKSQKSNTAEGIKRSIDMVEKLIGLNPAYTNGDPSILEHVQKLKSQNPSYVAHEYFNKDWHPMNFSNLSEELDAAKLSFACSANFHDHVDSVILTADQQNFIKNAPGVALRENLRDFILGRRFRTDYWVKGARKLKTLDQVTQVQQQRFILSSDIEQVKPKVAGYIGGSNMKVEVYHAVLDILADLSIHKFKDISDTLAAQNITAPQIMHVLLILVHRGFVAIAQDDATIEKASATTKRLNQHILSKARSSGELSHLASPVTGSGINANRIDQLFLIAIEEGHKSLYDWAASAWKHLSLLGEKVTHHGKTLETPEENLDALRKHAADFERTILPVLRALKVI